MVAPVLPPPPPTAHTSDLDAPQTPEMRAMGIVPLGMLDQTRAGRAATVVMENVTGVRPGTVAVAVLVPTVGPVMNFAAAFPLASVITVSGVTVPPPAVTVKATLTPDFGLFEASVTSTRMESEKLAPAGTLVGSAPTFDTIAATVTVVPVESPLRHAVGIKSVRTADI